jgi:glutathione synthase/RimK-type ligase-like ATP-grasp enzyme
MNHFWPAHKFEPLRGAVGSRYRKWSLDRKLPSMPMEAVVPIDETPDVLLLCSRTVPRFDPKTYLQELAFAHELAARQRAFAVTDDPSTLFEKSIVWFLPDDFVSPRLWDYSRQVREFALGLERQGNHLFCSSAETLYWENKATMHRKLDEIGVPTPRTTSLTGQNWESAEFDIEPALIKEEHSAGSAGVHYFPTAAATREFVSSYRFRPTETLLMQEVVPGAKSDLRLTMVGDKMIASATFWRTKGAGSSPGLEWTTTATKYGSVVRHGDVPESIVPAVAEYLRELGIRTAGVDVMWRDDDLSRDPLILELSPYYQPNPPKPERYRDWTYTQYKNSPYIEEGYLFQQYLVFRSIAGEILDQELF